MSAQDGPPQGMETKNVPGYVPAQVVNSDHPGHMGTKDAGGFTGAAGYTNTPGILDPEEKSSEDEKAPAKKTAAKSSSSTSSS